MQQEVYSKTMAKWWAHSTRRGSDTEMNIVACLQRIHSLVRISGMQTGKLQHKALLVNEPYDLRGGGSTCLGVHTWLVPITSSSLFAPEPLNLLSYLAF